MVHRRLLAAGLVARYHSGADLLTDMMKYFSGNPVAAGGCLCGQDTYATAGIFWDNFV